MIQESLDNAVEIVPGLWSVNNLFEENELDELFQRIENEPEENWGVCRFGAYNQSNNSRLELKWITDGVLDDIWVKLDSLDYSRFGFKFRTAIVWKDYEGYRISEHADSEHIIGSMQIYLNNAPENLGTVFGEHALPFIPNTGYIMDNIYKRLHKMPNAVPKGVTRYSLYALFDYMEDKN